MIKNSLLAFLLLLSCNAAAQYEDYSYQRRLTGIKGQWHSIVLPDDIFKNISPELNDFRIIGVSDDQDTLEAPYIIRQNRDMEERRYAEFTMLNKSKNYSGYYYTFEIPEEEVINRIELGFARKNFNWNIVLTGSNDQQEWFTLLSDYRILSIVNELTDYRFTLLKFPDAKYRYFRIQIKSDETPNLTTTRFSKYAYREGTYRDYKISVRNDTILEGNNVINLELKDKVPVNYIKLNIKDSIDYYRPLSFEYVWDSTETEKGWQLHYKSVHSAVLSSEDANSFKFPGTFLKKLRVRIRNGDNQALEPGDIEVKGYEYEIIARFTAPAEYYLLYGNSHATAPSYDIANFQDKIPLSPATVQLGEEMQREKKVPATMKPLFENQAWLWGIIISIMLLLGIFTFKMMKKV